MRISALMQIIDQNCKLIKHTFHLYMHAWQGEEFHIKNGSINYAYTWIYSRGRNLPIHAVHKGDELSS